MWERILKADNIGFYGLKNPKGWTSADGKTTVNLTGLPDIREFLNVEIHEALHSATHKEIIEAGFEAIDKHKADITNVDNYRFSERGTIMKRPAFNAWLDKAKDDIGATIAFHEISSFLGNKVEFDYNRTVSSAINYTPQFIDDAKDLWIGVLRHMRPTSIKASGVEKNPFGKRLPKLKEYKDIFSRVVGFRASQIFVDVLSNNKDWSNSTQRSFDSQTPETIEEVRDRNFKKSLIRKVYSDKDIEDLYVETHQYLRISCGILGFNFGEKSQGYTLAGLMRFVGMAVAGQQIDLEKQFMRLDDVLYEWPDTQRDRASELLDSLYRMLKFRQEHE